MKITVKVTYSDKYSSLADISTGYDRKKVYNIGPVACIISFKIVIYDRNDSTIIRPVVNINYKHKVRS